MKIRTLFIPALIMALIAPIACNRMAVNPADQEKKLSGCIGQEHHELLTTLTGAFGDFLVDNRFCRNHGELLEGYKNWLRYLLEQKGPDTAWKFRYNELEAMVTEMEALHFAELLYDQKFTNCVLEMEFPEGWLMADYREVMPQHTVSPQKFAGEFINRVNEEQFEDPVIRKVVALEYFLGPILHILRPDSMYLA